MLYKCRTLWSHCVHLYVDVCRVCVCHSGSGCKRRDVETIRKWIKQLFWQLMNRLPLLCKCTYLSLFFGNVSVGHTKQASWWRNLGSVTLWRFWHFRQDFWTKQENNHHNNTKTETKQSICIAKYTKTCESIQITMAFTASYLPLPR